MDRAYLKHVAAHVLFAGVLVAMVPAALRAQTANDLHALNQQVVQLYGQGKYAEAAAVAREALSLTERVLGKEHPGTLTSVNNLAALYKAQGRLAEAEPLFKRALEARERVLGKEDAGAHR
jgi:Flp pilus assembly protein TadD